MLQRPSVLLRRCIAAASPRAAAAASVASSISPQLCGGVGSSAASASRRPPARGVVSRAPTFNGFYISKPGAALNLRVLHPRFSPSSPGSTFVVAARAGRLVIDLAKNAGPPDGQRAYDWARKLGFALSAAELTQLATASFAQPLRLTHWVEDEGGGRARAVTMTIAPAAGGGGGGGGSGGGGGGGGGGAGAPAAFTLSIAQMPAGGGAGAEPERLASIDLSQNDLALLKHLISQSIVWVTGWMLNLDPTAFHPEIHLSTTPPASAGRGGRAAAPPAAAAPGGGE